MMKTVIPTRKQQESLFETVIPTRNEEESHDESRHSNGEPAGISF